MTDHIVWTDRSRVEEYQSCARRRWYTYHQGGVGMSPARKSLPLAVGGSVHVGLASLLQGASEDEAVVDAITDFTRYHKALALDSAEAPQPDDLSRQLTFLGDADAAEALMRVHEQRVTEYDDWLWREQMALVEGLVRAWARRRLRPLLDEYEVLEVEREGDWELSEKWKFAPEPGLLYYAPDESPSASLRFMSRPDALLRSRADGQLYLQSFKTLSTWDVRRARDAEHDMQGLSEAVEVERRLGERVMGIRYEYLRKGYRAEDKDLSAKFGLKVWSQRSHLVRAWRGDAGWCWSYDFLKDDGSASKLYWKAWRPESTWEAMTTKEWIDLLDSTEATMSAEDTTVGLAPRELGYRSVAQAQGYTVDHPLDSLFPPPQLVYRSDDQARDWIDQIEAQERRVTEGVAAVDAATDEGERRHLLNVHFPMSRRACSYPTECVYTKVCYGGEDIQRDPMGSGLYRIREANHPQERATT
jgi:hypothetical protein